MSRLSVICVLVFSLSVFIGCNKEKESMQGHIIFLHIGEQDKPISSFVFTYNDSSYLKYVDIEYLNETMYLLSRDENYLPSNIERINLLTFKDLKNKLLDFKESRKKTVVEIRDHGSFRILIKDTNDSITFDAPKGQLTKETMIEIIAIAEKNNLEKTKQRFLRYSDMQD